MLVSGTLRAYDKAWLVKDRPDASPLMASDIRAIVHPHALGGKTIARRVHPSAPGGEAGA
ncbi:hypothetical protein GCM10009560_39670 [Nonomuraea longicatena]|uniref:Uncharacterized protein n=1 Tax=Nonomuraea longicatena TaxID=83682 RepID=A0ABN1PW16_9ACTN